MIVIFCYFLCYFSTLHLAVSLSTMWMYGRIQQITKQAAMIITITLIKLDTI